MGARRFGAVTATGTLVRGDESPCPGCGGVLKVCHGPKLGPYRRHIGRTACRFAPKPMTPWHRRWQDLCDRPGWLTEQIVGDGAGGMHIADAVTAVG